MTNSIARKRRSPFENRLDISRAVWNETFETASRVLARRRMFPRPNLDAPPVSFCPVSPFTALPIKSPRQLGWRNAKQTAAQVTNDERTLCSSTTCRKIGNKKGNQRLVVIRWQAKTERIDWNSPASQTVANYFCTFSLSLFLARFILLYRPQRTLWTKRLNFVTGSGEAR